MKSLQIGQKKARRLVSDQPVMQKLRDLMFDVQVILIAMT